MPSANLIFRISLLAVLILSTGSRAESELEFMTVRLSDRVLTISSLTGNSRAIAISSEKGLVLIDTFWSPRAAREAREIIKREFNREDFIYIINTNAGALSSRGNAAFHGVPIIGHVDCKKSLARSSGTLDADLGSRADEFTDRIVRSEAKLEEVEPGSDRARYLRNWIDFCRHIEEDLRQGYEIVLPEITFSDRMNVDLGDMTLELLYFGSTGNHGDTFVMVPEEGLVWVGDVYHAAHTLPDARGAIGEVDVNRWVESLQHVVARGDSLKHVIRANGDDMWTVERIREHADLFLSVRREVDAADAAGQTLEETIDAFSPVAEKYPFVRNWATYEMYGDRILMTDIDNTVRFLWRRIHSSAASEIARLLDEKGEAAAQSAFREMRSAVGNDYYFSESEFNSRGYEYLRDNRVIEAIAMFRFAVEAFPRSANVYDSLGEGYMIAGRKQLAIENYRKSLELDPGNTNAAEMLRELGDM
jgi:hypothetical protein